MLAKNTSGGDDPAVVAKVIVAAATDRNPKLRRTAGPLASRVTTARRLVPAGVFDKQIRKNNRMAGSTWPAAGPGRCQPFTGCDRCGGGQGAGPR
ncbi:hypothetical protein SVIOM74S_02921 [Streptomyces violarus]